MSSFNRQKTTYTI